MRGHRIRQILSAQNTSLKRRLWGSHWVLSGTSGQRNHRLNWCGQIVDIELKLMSISFLKHGSIYYKADLDSKGHTSEPLSVDVSESSIKIDCIALDKFTVGPLTEARLWAGERASMKLDQGPCEHLGK